MTPVEQAVAQYTPFLHREARRCARKMPPTSSYGHDDLVSEGYEVLLRCVTRFQAEQGYRFLTYYGVALAHRFGRLVGREWVRYGGAGGRPPTPLSRLTTPAEQEAWTAVRERLRQTVQVPDRFRRFRRAVHPILSMEGQDNAPKDSARSGRSGSVAPR